MFLTVTSCLMNLQCKRSWITWDSFNSFFSFQRGHGSMACSKVVNPQDVQISGPCGPILAFENLFQNAAQD